MSTRQVERAREGSAAWRDAADLQGAAPPHHQDFAELGAEIAETLGRLYALLRVLHPQVRDYGEAHVIRAGMRDVNPHVLLQEATRELGYMIHVVSTLNPRAARFVEHISHIGTEG